MSGAVAIKVVVSGAVASVVGAVVKFVAGASVVEATKVVDVVFIGARIFKVLGAIKVVGASVLVLVLLICNGTVVLI